ncbi:antiviral innate immune response receptor RIG-I-like isoform X2 [Biomphalaria glabrata]|uniref:RNA helicase n=1 Tax=Biomphalaria glabrata TaxID=6526 RepID=A0A9W2YRS5_BIOGL|nr:antiviral innate immune response receptor RIG-I-like isoform X2 [Biomphalaria glabrata]
MALQEVDVKEYLVDWESLSLTEEEVKSPVWKQILDNNVIDRKYVHVSEEQESIEDDLANYTFENDFSDEDEDSEPKTKDQFDRDVNTLKLRDYQKELICKARGVNAVICAPTGSGKTRVATQIILDHLQQPGEKKKKVVFLATTVPLTMQQYNALLKYLPEDYKITPLNGQSKNSMSLESLLDYNDIFVMTPMILVNNVKNCNLKLDIFTLIVFDECHHTRKEEPYNLLMTSYLKDKAQGLVMPQILGLSATISIEESLAVDQARKVILEFLGNLDAHYLVTVQDHIEEMNLAVPKPTDEYQLIKELTPDETLIRMTDVMNKIEAKVIEFASRFNDKDVKKCLSIIPLNKKLQAYGQWAVQLKDAVQKVPNKGLGKEDHEIILLLSDALEYLFSYNAALEIYDLVEPIDILNYLEKNFRKFALQDHKDEHRTHFFQYFQDLKQLILNSGEGDNPNLKVLADVLMKNLVKKDESRGIIFVKTRALAESIKAWFNRSRNSNLKTLNAEIFTGANVSEEQGGMSQNKQEEIKERFKSGDIKVLIATSVAEEGLDIQTCNLIVNYNHVGNEVTHVQKKGRSRAFGGICYLLAMEEVVKREENNKKKSVIMEQAIQQVSLMKDSERIALILEYQEKNMELLTLLEEQEKCSFKTADFQVVCRKCRQVRINSFNMRTILGKYRISIDRNLLTNKFIVCKPDKPEFMDELEFVGKTYCCGKLPSGATCGSQLGLMIKHKKVPFFNVGIKFIGILTDDSKPLLLCKQWKKMPYDIEELSFDDIKNYIKEM